MGLRVRQAVARDRNNIQGVPEIVVSPIPPERRDQTYQWYGLKTAKKCAVSEIFCEKELPLRPIRDELTSSTATLPLLGTRKEAVEL